MTKQILMYQTTGGIVPFEQWVSSLKDKNLRHRVTSRLDRLVLGNFGDVKQIAVGVLELRLHFGPGYRIYCGLDGDTIIILLCAGDKSTQSNDISRAQKYWKDYLRRKHESSG